MHLSTIITITIMARINDNINRSVESALEIGLKLLSKYIANAGVARISVLARHQIIALSVLSIALYIAEHLG